MTKNKKLESVLRDWVHGLTFQMQALLLTGVRGPDASPKENSAKEMVRYLRGAILKPAGEWDNANNNSFMWGEYNRPSRHGGAAVPIFGHSAMVFLSEHDEYPHHFIMHLIHCAQVIGYYHPDMGIRSLWCTFYLQMCESMHMHPESKEEMDARLNDFQ